MSDLRSQPPPLTDSVWFWAYLFLTGALIALALAAPKYGQRQAQLERQFLARQEGGQAVMGATGPVPPSTADNLIIPLRPLMILCGLALAIAWVRLWRSWHADVRPANE